MNETDRVGLIGANGEGKTTLIRLILGELDAESGVVFRKNGIRIGYLAQNGGYDSENTVFEEMRLIFTEDMRALESLREVEEKISKTQENDDVYRALVAKYEHLNKFIAARDSYHFEVKIRTVLNGMGFEKTYDQVINTMSGGEKTRLKLCALLHIVIHAKTWYYLITEKMPPEEYLEKISNSKCKLITPSNTDF